MFGEAGESAAAFVAVCTCCGDVTEFDSFDEVKHGLDLVARMAVEQRRTLAVAVASVRVREVMIYRFNKRGRPCHEGPKSYAERPLRVRLAAGWFTFESGQRAA